MDLNEIIVICLIIIYICLLLSIHIDNMGEF